jgi:2-polyprenyl-3-methyl-5-hydroxy-6-metoxy-1,4-benzoquinol methylase
MTEYIEANRAWWDKAAPVHVTGYQAEDLANDASAISTDVRIDAEIMAPQLPQTGVSGLSLLHLQCHIGTDTLSWARLGATATGLDFSAESLNEARRLSQMAGLDVDYVQSTVEDAAESLNGRQFDVIYTGVGALMWLADLDVWARNIRALLKPGGLFFVRDAHPILLALDDKSDNQQLVVRYPYFGNGAPADYGDDEEPDYADKSVTVSGPTYEFAHSLEEIIGSLLNAGLRLEAFHEHRTLMWQFCDWMTQVTDQRSGPRNDNIWALPPDQRDLVPLAFSVAARG